VAVAEAEEKVQMVQVAVEVVVEQGVIFLLL